jgi:hypothetical protein
VKFNGIKTKTISLFLLSETLDSKAIGRKLAILKIVTFEMKN